MTRYVLREFDRVIVLAVSVPTDNVVDIIPFLNVVHNPVHGVPLSTLVSLLLGFGRAFSGGIFFAE